MVGEWLINNIFIYRMLWCFKFILPFFVASKFEVQPNQLSMKHCIDGFMLSSSDQEVTAIHMVANHTPLLVYMAVSDENTNKVVALRSVEDDESKKPFFKTKVSLVKEPLAPLAPPTVNWFMLRLI